MSNQRDPDVTITAPLSHFNYALQIAAERPLKEAIGFVQHIESQVKAFIDGLNAPKMPPPAAEAQQPAPGAAGGEVSPA